MEFPQGAIEPFQVKVDSAPENCGSGPLGQRLTECTQVDIFHLDGSDLDNDTAPFVSAKITLTVRAARGIRVFRRTTPETRGPRLRGAALKPPRSVSRNPETGSRSTTLVISASSR